MSLNFSLSIKVHSIIYIFDFILGSKYLKNLILQVRIGETYFMFIKKKKNEIIYNIINYII